MRTLGLGLEREATRQKIRSIILKLFCPSIQEFGKADILRQAPKREPAELYCETVWIAFFWARVPR